MQNDRKYSPDLKNSIADSQGKGRVKKAMGEILLNISLMDITDFWEGRHYKSNYLLAFVIVRFLRWLVDYHEEQCISDARVHELNEYTVHFLDMYNLSSNSDKRRQKRNTEKETLLEKLRGKN